ncbi:hypothetical protein CGCS363_v001344 [Colletotrichum siamense]|uniref:uncharacterized protein n=1 Tax=Colletotrichum siamense TaxID=690259 RepID=UPI0018721832|nr:uncharacterized protein CGCS363_v001344 [Colletotrichum siamense]KAF5517113.1 hypothetical protein CGCS363_v001344 [Colletotrichum siamense]
MLKGTNGQRRKVLRTKRHRGRDLVPHDWDGNRSNVTHKKGRRDEVGDEEHQTGARKLPAGLEGEYIQEDEQQQEAAVSPVDDVDDRVSMVQRLCTGIDRQLHALNENPSNPESTLLTALSNAATTAVRQSLVDSSAKKLKQEISQCKQLLVRKKHNFDELYRSSQQQQREQADALRREQIQVTGLSKQLHDERIKLAKVSASLQAEQNKCAEVQAQLEKARHEVFKRDDASTISFRLQLLRTDSRQLSEQIEHGKNELAEVSCSLQAERVMCSELSDALREEKEKCSNLSRDLAAERRENAEDAEWHINTLRDNLSKINFKRSHPKESDSYSKLDIISTISMPLLTQTGTNLLDFFLRYSRPDVIYCFTHAIYRVDEDDDGESPAFRYGQCPLHLANERINDCMPVLRQEDPVEGKSFVFVRLDVAIEMTGVV